MDEGASDLVAAINRFPHLLPAPLTAPLLYPYLIALATMIASTLSLLALSTVASAHSSHSQTPLAAGPLQKLWYNTLPGDGGTQADSVFSGISTFGRLPYFPCLASEDEKYDIAFIGQSCDSLSSQVLYIQLTDPGAPFDTGTSYRPGARFGPSGIRQGSRRLNL